jgi:hypothetical protein
MQRRALLSTCAVLAVGGCLTARPQQSRLAFIWLVNDRDEPYDVDVVVEDDGETVFSKIYELGTEPDTANANDETPVAGPGQYVVRATMDGETRTVDTTEAVDGDEDCVGVRFSLLDNGSVDYWTKSMQEC